VNCDEARLLIGADPSSVTPELMEHLDGCAACAQFRREMLALEGNIRIALHEPPVGARRPEEERDGASIGASSEAASGPAGAATGTVTTAPWGTIRGRGRDAARQPGRPRWSGWAIAATVLLGLFATVAVWVLRPSESLAHDVVMHVQSESDSWAQTAPVQPGRVEKVLRRAGVELDSRSGDVVYAQSCPFRGHRVPHLVVMTPHGPVTVLILRHENVKHPEHFHESGMSGVITPAPSGSIAVLVQGDAPVDDVAQQLERSVRWLPDSP
jgi:Protein of unknown function (DUF3379)